MIEIICMGKLKEEFYKEAEREYKKRIDRFTKIEIKEVEKIKENCDFTVLLDEKGEEMNSENFARFLREIMLQHKKVCFLIGSWEGFEEGMKERADFLLSLSRMTFPYQLCRIILLEQIYRAFTIIKGMSYHK